MATFEYKCIECGHQFIRATSLSEHRQHPKTTCPKCGSTKVEPVPQAFFAVTGKKA